MVPVKFNLVDHGESLSEVGPGDNCRGQSPSELPSTLDVPSVPTVPGNDSADKDNTITTASTSRTVTPCTVAVSPPENYSPYLNLYSMFL